MDKILKLKVVTPVYDEDDRLIGFSDEDGHVTNITDLLTKEGLEDAEVNVTIECKNYA